MATEQVVSGNSPGQDIGTGTANFAMHIHPDTYLEKEKGKKSRLKIDTSSRNDPICGLNKVICCCLVYFPFIFHSNILLLSHAVFFLLILLYPYCSCLFSLRTFCCTSIPELSKPYLFREYALFLLHKPPDTWDSHWQGANLIWLNLTPCTVPAGWMGQPVTS